MFHIQRTRFAKDIVTEFIAPRRKTSRKVMIFCSGMPSAPCKSAFMEFWAEQGYWVFFPRYRGTWESGGEFLKLSPTQDILDVIESLDKPFQSLWEDTTYSCKAEDVVLIGSSFGGPAALLLSSHPQVSKVVAISPVVDWRTPSKAEPLDWLYTFLKDAYGEGIRVKKPYWNKLIRGNFYNPATALEEIDGSRVMIIHAEDDQSVTYKPVARLAKKVGATFVSRKRGGHLSSSVITKPALFKRVSRFLNT